MPKMEHFSSCMPNVIRNNVIFAKWQSSVNQGYIICYVVYCTVYTVMLYLHRVAPVMSKRLFQIDSPVLITLPDWSWCSFIADKTPHPIHVWNLNPMRKLKTCTDKATIENRHHNTQNYPLFLLLVHDI